MSLEKDPNAFMMTRHGYKPSEAYPESVEYPGLAEGGLEKARERAREMVCRIEELPKGTVVFLSGVSDLPRTRSTLAVYGEEVKKILQEKGSDISVITPDELSVVLHARTYIVQKLKSKPDTTAVVIVPMFLNDFSPEDVLMKDGALSPAVTELLERCGGDEQAALREWLAGTAHNATMLPRPEEVAERYIAGIGRLQKFAESQLHGRAIVVGGVGHSWALDALAVYITQGGHVTLKGFDALGGEMIQETQLMQLTERNGQRVMEYGGKEYPLTYAE